MAQGLGRLNRTLAGLSGLPAAAVLLWVGAALAAPKTFRAGVNIVDITPRTFPIITSGGFLTATARRAEGTLHARALALDDGKERIVIVVVDSLMMPREMLDRVKQAASRSAGIPSEKMLIGATHTHSAPALMGALGTDFNAGYSGFVEPRIVQAIQGAVKNLAPARVGWTVIQDSEHTHCRRWILRPDRIRKDPFGQLTVRANMHPGYENPDFVGPAGPVDPGLTVLALQSPQGRPIALLANYSMHYVGAPTGVVSPDYYGSFVENIERLTGVVAGMMSQGTSGDQHWMDYSRPRKDMNLRMYADALAQIVVEAYKTIQYRDWVPLAMAETRLRLSRRAPDAARLAWAKEIIARMGGAIPRNQQEVYAREQVYLAAEPERELKFQALRIGELGIAAFPNEVFALSGLKIKAQSPLNPTFNITLANGAEGYIPPPEQHKLGGYTTWPARTAALEPNAEPKIVEALLALLERVSHRRRRPVADEHGAYAQAVLAAKPLAYWRGNELQGPQARDTTRRNNHGAYEDGIAFYLEGPASPAFSGIQVNRAPHYAGGRLRAVVSGLRDRYSLEMWFYNGLPANARPLTGYLFCRSTDRLGIGGAQRATGKLFFQAGNTVLEGKTPVGLKTWNHLVLTRQGEEVSVYLNGEETPEITGRAQAAAPSSGVLIGGCQDNSANFEGRIDEVSMFSRRLTAGEAVRHFAAGGVR